MPRGENVVRKAGWGIALNCGRAKADERPVRCGSARRSCVWLLVACAIVCASGPAALAQAHIIIAAFNTGQDLPEGRTRIATIHLQITGEAEPQYELNLMVAGDADGEEIPAEITFEKGEPK